MNGAISITRNVCTCCGIELKEKGTRWLELDQRTQTYHNFGNVPTDKSQGAFPFGFHCAKRTVAEARLVIAKAAKVTQ